MGREVGGGIGMGKTCEPKAFSFRCMTKFTTNKKINKIKLKKKKKGLDLKDLRHYGKNLDSIIFLFFWPCPLACRILVPQTGIEPVPLTVKVRSPNQGLPCNFQILFL